MAAMARPPVIIESTRDFATALRADREALKLSGESLDALIGWPDRYTAKVESPDEKWGRKALRIDPTAVIWLSALGRSLVIMDTEQAVELCRQMPPAETDVRLVRRRVMRTSFVIG